MTYLKINNNDYSMFVNELKANRNANYNVETNAAGDSVVDYINHKWKIEVGIIPLDSAVAANLLNEIEAFNVSISFLNPISGELESIDCFIASSNVEYYTIQANNTMLKAFKLKFIEL